MATTAPKTGKSKLAAERKAFGEELMDLTRKGDRAAIEQAWSENLDKIPRKGAFLREWLKAMVRLNAKDLAEQLICMLAERLLDTGKPKTALTILAMVLKGFNQGELMRPLLARVVRAVYADVEQIEELIGLADLEGETAMPQAYLTFTQLWQVTPGQVYQHYDWGEGVIEELDLESHTVKIRFPDLPLKTIKIEGARKSLKYVEPTHFLARRATEPAEMQDLAENRPAELIKLALASQSEGRIKQGELKTLLSPSIVPARSWTTWWTRAREALKVDPYIDFAGASGLHMVIRLRETPRTFAEEIEERFLAADASRGLRGELIRELTQRSNEIDVPGELIGRMAAALRMDLADRPADAIPARVEVAYMLADLAEVAPAAVGEVPPTQDLLARVEDYRLLAEIEHVDYAIRALEVLLHRDGEAGCHRAADLLPDAGVKLAQAIWRALDEERHVDYSVQALQRLIDEPQRNIETFAWAVRAILDGSWGHLEDYFPAAGLVPELLAHMEDWHRVASDADADKDARELAKSLLSRTRAILSARKYDPISKAVEGVKREAAQRLLRTIQRHDALPSAFKHQAERAINLTRRDLEEAEAATDEMEEVLCTAQGYVMLARRLRELTTVEIPKNTREIETARAEGDLRENAGYQYAKEQQKLLYQEQTSLTIQLHHSRVVTADEVGRNAINFGTRFRALNTTLGAEETWTILGRWEANAERHILSVQAPLAQQFLGKRPGDHVTVEHPGGGSSDYEILSIENALHDSEWQADIEAIETPAPAADTDES